MNFMNRKMFQAGGGANVDEKYFFIDKTNKTKTFIDPKKLYNDLSRSDPFTITSFVQNPDVTYSPATEEILRQLVYEKMEQFSSVDPNTFEFGTQLPDYLTTIAGVRDVAGGIGQGAVGALEGALNVLQKYGRGFGEGGKKRVEEGFVPRDILPGGIGSERMPFSTETMTGSLSDTDPLGVYDRGGMLRQGIPQTTLVDALSRSGVGDVITDFSNELNEIQAPTPKIAGEDGTDRAAYDFRNEDMRSKVGQAEYDSNVARREQEIKDDPISQTLGVAEFDVDERIKAFEKAMEGRNEFGELIPTDKPPTPEMQPQSLSPGLDEIDVLVEDILPEEIIVKNKFDVADIRPELAKVDLSITESDLDKFNDAAPPQVPKQTTGIFGSDRFLDFIRNVGGELARTGQMGEGLATGAAKAAEERTARELLKAQEDKKFEDAKKLLEIEANLTGTDPMSVSDLDKIKTNEEELSVSLRNFKKSENTLSNLNTVIKILDSEDATGFKGFFGEATDMIESAIKSDTGKSFDELEPRTRANALLKVLRQANVREILGESGKTISNLDRQIVEDVFGDIKLGTPRGVSLKKLKDSRQNIIGNLEQSRDQITSAKTFFDNARFNSPVYAKNYDLIQLINNFNFDNALNYIKDATGSSAGITDIGLAPDA
tara:strand:+ start:502 stop:2475 length:1974 start_codon:yes stop_codon:yes gene_type:complete